MSKKALSNLKKTNSLQSTDNDLQRITNLKIFGALANNTSEPLLNIIKNEETDNHSRFTAYTAFFQLKTNRSQEFRFSSKNIIKLIEDFLAIMREDKEVYSYTPAFIEKGLKREDVLEKVLTNILSDIFDETDNLDRHHTEKVTQLFILFDSILKIMLEGPFVYFEKNLKTFALDTIDNWYGVNFSPSIGKVFSSGRAHMNTTIFRFFIFNGLVPKKVQDYSLRRFKAWFLLEQECMFGRKLKSETRLKAMEEKFKALK